jgi:hypothetical protein
MFKGAARKAAVPRDFVGSSGRRYVFQQLIQERPHLGRVWLAMFVLSSIQQNSLTDRSSDEEQFILKEIPDAIFSAYETTLRQQIRESPYLRLPFEAIPQQRIHVYRWLTDDFLSLINKKIAMKWRKKILKDSLRGLMDLHATDVVHLGL